MDYTCLYVTYKFIFSWFYCRYAIHTHSVTKKKKIWCAGKIYTLSSVCLIADTINYPEFPVSTASATESNAFCMSKYAAFIAIECLWT